MTIKEIASLQFITREHPTYSHAEQVKLAMKGGIRWVQLRMVDAPPSELEEQAIEALKWARHYKGTLIINDDPYLAHKIDADGVHLGKTDMSLKEARHIVGPDKIIGATCNTIDDIQHLRLQSVDYIGLGPFRYTKTKKNLSTVLGMDGYRQIFQKLEKEGVFVPILAIGGIEEADFAELFTTGIHGIAISGAIAQGNDIEENARRILKEVNHLVKEKNKK